jgi:hypothetical protein
VFEGLLPEHHNSIVMDLLFELATWHAFAKLRLHTASTLNALDDSTTRLGRLLRQFTSKTCAAFQTRELPSEEAARGRRQAALAAKGQSVTKDTNVIKRDKGSKSKLFSLSTYKIHALGDYVKAIQM